MSGENDWTALYLLLGVFVLAAVAAAVAGRRSGTNGGPLRWVNAGLERATGIPGWAAGMVGTALLGLLMAGIGFYDDVAWHVGLGRDEELFTAPHTMIVMGLGFIAVASASGILLATVSRATVGFRVGALRVPWSAAPLALLGIAALSGFALDELWHAEYGIDVTMWSPTHMLMIMGASLSPVAAWFALAEAGVRPEGIRNRAFHVLTAWLVMGGLTSAQGEFEFGVPQFQQLYHPVLVLAAAGIALVAIRLVLGPGWAIIVAALTLVLEMNFGSMEGIDITTRQGGVYLGSAVAVELAALALGTANRVRFALASAVGIATIGLAAEWAWNQRAHQPWNTNLLPDAFLVGGLAAVGAALVGAAVGAVIRREPGRLHPMWTAAGGAVLIAALLIPFPRRTGDVTATITLDRTGDDTAMVNVELEPADAADDARWFQTIAWQGGGLVLAEMEEIGPGEYRSDRPVPITGSWKTLVRLHRGAELMSAPVWLPEDEEIHAEEIPAVDRQIEMAGEKRYLMREAIDGAAGLAVAIYSLIALIAAAWIAAFAVAGSRIARVAAVPAARERAPVR